MSYNEISFHLLENVSAPPGHVAAVCSDLEFSPFFRSASLPFLIKKYFSSWAFHLLKYAIYNFLRDYDRNSTYYSFKVLEFKLVKPSIEFQFLIFLFLENIFYQKSDFDSEIDYHSSVVSQNTFG